MAAAFAAAPVLTTVLLASTVATVAFTVISAQQQAKASRRQRQAEQRREEQARVQGVQESNEILRQQLAAFAEATVSSAGSGVDPFSGSPLSTAQKIEEKADRQLSTSNLNNSFDIAASRSRQNQLRLQGRAATIGAISSVTRSLGGGAASVGGIAPAQQQQF